MSHIFDENYTFDYLVCPQCLLSLLFTTSTGIGGIFDYALYHSFKLMSSHKKLTFNQLVNWLIEYIRIEGDYQLLSSAMIDELDSFVNEFAKGDKERFIYGIRISDTEEKKNAIVDRFRKFAEQHEEFEEKLTECFTFYRSLSMGHVVIRENTVDDLIRRIQHLEFDFSGQLTKSPTFTVNLEVMWDLVKKYYYASPATDELAAVAFYFGALSIIGSRDFVEITSSLLKIRMFGCSSAKDFEQLTAIPSRKKAKMIKVGNSIRKAHEFWQETIAHHTTRRRYEKYLLKMQQTYGVVELGVMRRTYLSVKLDHKKLAQAIADKKTHVKERKLKADKKDAIKSILDAVKTQ